MSKIIEYRDQLEGFPGWLVYDGLDCRIAAGGCRVQPGLTVATLSQLAARMTLKERLLGINVDGAKCGIDYDPRSPGKAAALRRFLAFLSDELHARFSMGCDMGTQWNELEALAALEGIPSVKVAVRAAQGFSDEDFALRIGSLDEPVGALTLGQRRAGHALAQAAVVAAALAQLPQPRSYALQGFGNLGRAAAYTLLEEGFRLTAVADEYACVADPAGLDVAGMLRSEHASPVPQLGAGAALPSAALFEQRADILILAAGEDAMPMAVADALSIPVVVVGANCGLSPAVEARLHERGVLVVPDFVGGIGGSASMEALFGPVRRPSGQAVLDGVSQIMSRLVTELFIQARDRGLPLRAVADDFAAAAAARLCPGERPYGCSPFLDRAPVASVAHGLSR